MERIVLDTNCLVQSISPRSAYRKVWDSFFDGTNLLCVTTSILNEYEEILTKLANEETAKYIVTEDHHYDVIKWKDFPGIDVIGLDDFLLHLSETKKM